MKVVIFGATGMVGKGVLLECLEDGALSTYCSSRVIRPTRSVLQCSMLCLQPSEKGLPVLMTRVVPH